MTRNLAVALALVCVLLALNALAPRIEASWRLGGQRTAADLDPRIAQER
jgi:hypothetical protein